MPELTQEQIDQMIADAKKGLFTEEDLNRRVTSEVDRRVETGIKKGLETQKQKWEEEIAKKASMTAEERARQEYEERFSELSTKEKEVLRKANLTDAKEILSEAEIPKTYYEKFIGVLVSDDTEVTKTNVDNFVEMFKATKTDIETQVRSSLSKVEPPKQGNGDKPVTKEDFNKMGYVEKIKFKGTHPEMYKEFIK